MAPAMADQDDDWSDSDDEAEGQTPEFGDKRTFNFPTEWKPLDNKENLSSNVTVTT